MENSGTPLFSSLDARIEAVIFASKKPIQIKDLSPLLPDGSNIFESLSRIKEFWRLRGINLVETKSGWKFTRNLSYHQSNGKKKVRKLSKAAGATLITIAMHQPITVQQIEEIRRVKLSREIIDVLVESGFIRQVGRKSGTGRAMLWEITEQFLDWCEMDQLSDMPTLEELMLSDIGTAPV